MAMASSLEAMLPTGYHQAKYLCTSYRIVIVVPRTASCRRVSYLLLMAHGLWVVTVATTLFCHATRPLHFGKLWSSSASMRSSSSLLVWRIHMSIFEFECDLHVIRIHRTANTSVYICISQDRKTIEVRTFAADTTLRVPIGISCSGEKTHGVCIPCLYPSHCCCYYNDCYNLLHAFIQ